jgi:adenosylmethionine-8-amino-7-oxononanoate aminotransferase
MTVFYPSVHYGFIIYQDEKVGERVRQEMMNRKLFTRISDDVILLAPPLVTTDEQIDQIVDITRQAIETVVPGKA